MCAYCNMGDSWFRHDTPFEWRHTLPPSPYMPPQPFFPNQPINPWPIDKLSEYLNLLKEVKALEESIGCPCDPAKPDYIKILQDRLDTLRARQGGGAGQS